MSSSSKDVFKTSAKRLDQGEYIRHCHTSSEDVFKTCSIRLQDFLLRRLEDVLQKPLQDIFKMSCVLQNVFKTFCKGVFKTLQYVSSSNTVLLTRLQDVFDIFLKHTPKTIIYRKIFPAHTSEKFMVNLQNFQKSTLWIHIDTFKFFKKKLWSDCSTNKDIIVKVGYQKWCRCLSK